MAYIYMFKQLWHYAGEERWKIVVYYLLHAISILGELGKPFAFAMVINSLQANRPTLIAEVLRWLSVYALCYVVFRVFHVSSRYIELPVAFRCRRRFVDSMYDRLQSLPLSWHTEHHSGNVIDRVNVAANALHHFGNAQMCYIEVFMKFWGPLIILWGLSPEISVFSLAVGVLIVVVTRKLYSHIVPLYRGQLDGFHDFAAAFFDYMSNMKTIITLRLGKYVKEDLDNRMTAVFPYIIKEHNVTQMKCVSTAFLTLILEASVIFYYIWTQQQAGSVIMIGAVTAIFQYVGQLMESFMFYVGDYEKVIHWKADFEAVKPVMDAKPQATLRSDSTPSEWRQITVQPIRFSYDGSRMHLEDVSVQLRLGKRIALVGESGSGKSTLLAALRGIIDIPDVYITVDGETVMPLAALSGTTTLIPQEPEIFENTIRHNITMGIPAEDEEVLDTVRVSCFDQVVGGLPNGLETDIREKGVNLSGGEKQRLALARGIFAIKDSSMVLLDEPTSNIDPGTEMTIFERLLGTLDGRCVVSSLHRLHLLRMFDYIYVMKDGRIVEEGTFSDLCEKDGEFARLWAVYQSETDERVS